MRSLAGFIPARGGSKQVIRKNLRLVDGKPLVQHAIELARSVCESVIVSTDDPDIAAVARLSGAGVVERPFMLADDYATVDDVVAEYRQAHADPLLVVQPTVIGLTHADMTAFVGEWAADGMPGHRVMVTPAQHIFWQAGRSIPTVRGNRQDITGLDREIGVRLYAPDPFDESYTPWQTSTPTVDIDSAEDLLAARHMLERKRILFRVLANQQVGHGHLRRVLSLAEELQHHDVGVLLDPRSDASVVDLIPPAWLATEFVYPDVVVNDTLDTAADDKLFGTVPSVPRIHFEDKGPGARTAAAVINSLYPGDGDLGGPDWAIIRPEFFSVPKTAGEGVLISFGGTDPAGLTETMAKKLAGLRPRVIAPPGREIGDVGEGAIVVEDASVAEEIGRAKVVVSGGGRTVYESLFCQRPVVAICQNPRELTHSHLDPGFGVYRAGLAGFGGEQQGAMAAINLMADSRMWQEFRDRTVGVVDGLGVRRCGTLIENTANGLRR